MTLAKKHDSTPKRSRSEAAHIEEDPVEREGVAQVLEEEAEPAGALYKVPEDALAVAEVDGPQEVPGSVPHKHRRHARMAWRHT